MLDITQTTQAKSDQLNAVDLVGAPKTITVTKVSLVEGDQPVTINYRGDEGKPYKPCKGMRRALVAAWGKDGESYVGRSMTLVCNPDVTWAGSAVGGIQISHMSDIDQAVKFPLALNRQKKVMYTIDKLQAAPTPTKAMSKQEHQEWLKAFEACQTMADLSEVGASIKGQNYDIQSGNMLKAAYIAAVDRIKVDERNE